VLVHKASDEGADFGADELSVLAVAHASGKTEEERTGQAVKTIMGAPKLLPENISPTVPPATDRKALPAIPEKKRKTSKTAIFGAKAHGSSSSVNNENETRYIGLRP
jgi:hypothetical protein